MTDPGGPPTSWSTSQLTSWLVKDQKLDPEAIDVLALCNIDGRTFLEMVEEDLTESDELGLDMKSIQTFLRLQTELEAIQLAHDGEKPPVPGASVLPASLPPPGEGAGSAAGPAVKVSGPSSTWSLPCVSVDAEGNSFFTEKTVALGAKTRLGIGALSELIPTVGVKFRETPGDYDFDFHVAPARQLVVSLDASVDIEVTDGTRMIFPPGTVMLAEDTWGKGHRSRAVNGKPRKALFLPLPDDFKL